MSNTNHPFWVIVNKEISDYVRSWRFIILIVIIALTCMGSLYTALTNIREAIKPNDPDGAFLFLKLFTVSDGTLPSFAVFISFLGPLLGISLGFDAINSEQNKGTLSRILSQPIHRDYLINAKFVAADCNRHHVVHAGISGHGIRADCDRNPAYGRRVYACYLLSGRKSFLCGILVELVDILFDPF